MNFLTFHARKNIFPSPYQITYRLCLDSLGLLKWVSIKAFKILTQKSSEDNIAEKNTSLTNYDFKKTTILPVKHRLIYVQRKGGGRNKKEKSRNRFCVAVFWTAFLPRNMRKTTINFCFANCSWHQKGGRSGWAKLDNWDNRTQRKVSNVSLSHPALT